MKLLGALYCQLRQLFAKSYQFLAHAREWLEHHHAAVLLIELILLLFTVTKAYALFTGMHELHWSLDELKEVVESVMFVVLAVWFLSDIVVSWRSRSRGYDFTFVAKTLKPAPLRGAREHMLSVVKTARANGLHGTAGTQEDAGKYAEAIAEASANVFSPYTFETPDKAWNNLERKYLDGWFKEFPLAVWVLDVPEPSGESGSLMRYASVVIPIVDRSHTMIAQGHLNTALSHLDDQAVHFVAEVPTREGYVRKLQLLLYAQVYLDPNKRHHEANGELLVYCTLQHIASILERFWPGRWPGPDALSLICEVSSRETGALLEELGFRALKARSPVGFALHEWPAPELANAESLFELLRATLPPSADEESRAVA